MLPVAYKFMRWTSARGCTCIVPGMAAAAAAARDTKSKEAWVKTSATLLLATAETLQVSDEERRESEWWREEAMVLAILVWVMTMMVARAL